MKKVLAFDFGASSGRAIMGCFDGNRISTEEIHRFPNNPFMENGTLYWNFPELFKEVERAIDLAGDDYESIGFDTWGIDFALIDKEGRLVENPVNYRDTRTNGMMEEVFNIVSREELYSKTGTQSMNFNTIFQLYYLATRKPELLERTDKILFIPDMFVYMLTGMKKTEYTAASTTGLLDAKTHEWCWDFIERLGIPTRIFCEVVPSGTFAGEYKNKKVFYIGGHDTASAELAVPTLEKDFVFISSGTWSLMGTEIESPILEDVNGYNFTNEGCFDGKIRLLKNIMGLWLIQECRRQWIREGTEVSFAQLEKEALETEAGLCSIDVDDELFVLPGNMPERIREYCRRTGQFVPQSRGEVMRCIYDSLSEKYGKVFRQIKDITGKNFSYIHVVGGGSKDGLLAKFTSRACGVPVIAGPAEATAIGNIAGQLIASGDIKNIYEARKIIAESTETKKYE